MNPGEIRDQLWANLHAEVLRPSGFLKKGRWASKANPPFHYAIERGSDRWATSDSATLRLRVAVYHEGYHQFMSGAKFAGVGDSSVAVFNRGIKWLLEPPELTEEISPTTEPHILFAEYRNALEIGVLPFFSRCSSVEGVLTELRRRPGEFIYHAEPISGLLFLSGRASEAAAVIEAAKSAASAEGMRAKFGRFAERLAHAG